MKILFVINPVSGDGERDDVILRIHHLAVEQGFDFKFFYTRGEDDLQHLKEQIEAYQPDRIAAGGGDGTVMLVAKALLHQETPMGIIPLGSANGLATELDLPEDPVQAVARFVASEQTQKVDILQFNDEHLSIHLSDVGANALLVKLYEQEGDRQMLGYARHFLKVLRDSPEYTYTIEANGETTKYKGYMLAIANARRFGTGVYLSDKGSISDGKFELVNIRRIDFEALLKAGLTKFDVFVDDKMYKDVMSCEAAKIKVNQPAPFQVDGEYVGEEQEIEVKILPGAVTLCV